MHETALRVQPGLVATPSRVPCWSAPRFPREPAGDRLRRIRSPASRSIAGLLQRPPRLAAPVIRDIDCGRVVANATQGGPKYWQDVGRPRCWSTLRTTKHDGPLRPIGNCPDREQGGNVYRLVQVRRAQVMGQEADGAVAFGLGWLKGDGLAAQRLGQPRAVGAERRLAARVDAAYRIVGSVASWRQRR